MMRTAVLTIVGVAVLGQSVAATEAFAQRGQANGVAVTVDRRKGTTIRIVRSAARSIVRRGGKVKLTCGARSAPFPPVALQSATIEWPRGRPQVTSRELRGRYAFCIVRTRVAGERQSNELAGVPFNGVGRRLLDERDTAFWTIAVLQKVLIGADEVGGRYPTAEELSHVNLRPLATLTELPAAGEIGVYSSESERRLRVVKLTTRGVALYVDLTGGEFRTNAPEWVGDYLMQAMLRAAVL